MPIARIASNLCNIEHRRMLAKAGADVFRSLGLADEHITTVFTHLTGDDLFVADMTFNERNPDEYFVFATVSMGSKRDSEVRSLLAKAYTDAVGDLVARHNVCVDFLVRDGGDVYVGGAALGSATAHTFSQPGDGPVGIDQRLRSLLDRVWQVGYTEWDPVTPLAALRDDTVEWDSLAAAELAVIVETNLSLARDLDVGEERFREGLGQEATYADLLGLVTSCA